jgi:hypothetical protein
MKGMAKKITASLFLISLALISPFLATQVLAANPPIRYYGTVTLDGSAAADGHNVSIWNGETILGSVLTPAGSTSGSGYYSINLDASHTGKTLIFKVNNVNATTPTPESVTAGAPGSSTNQAITASSCTDHGNCSSPDYCTFDGKCATKLADLSNCSQKEYSGLADNNVCSGGYCYDDYSGGDEYCTSSATNCVSNQGGSATAYGNGTTSPTSTYWCGVVTSGIWTFDNPPVVSVAADLYPDSPYTTDALACKFTAHDDHTGLKANITWYKNAAQQSSLDQLQASLTNNTNFDVTNVSNALTNKTEAWSCNVTVYDTWGSTATTSDIVAILNSIPIIGNPTISNTTPYTNDTLTCSNGSFSDSDNDAATWYYRWWKQEGGSGDFSLISGEVSSTLGLTCSGCDETDAVKCSTIASDGTANATAWTNSSTATIQNYNPFIPSGYPILHPTNAWTNSTLWCEIKAIDIDPDSLVVCKSSYMNDTNQTSLYACFAASNNSVLNLTITSASTAKDQSWKCAATVKDGIAISAVSNSSSVYIKNYLPSKATNILNIDAGNTTNSTITCEFSTFDLDSDTLTAEITVYGNSTNKTTAHYVTTVSNNTAYNYTVAAGNTSKNNEYNCYIRIWDGTGYGDDITSAEVYIKNFIPDFSSAEDNLTTNDILYTGSVLVTSTISDVDNETLSFYVCNNSYANSSGCINESLCSNTTSTSNPSCTFEAPDTSGTYGWYAYVYDSEGAAATSNGDTESYTVYNTSTNLSAGASTNVYIGNYTTLWCDYQLQSNGSDITNATCSISGDITNSSLVYNATGSRYEANWTATSGTAKGAKSFNCSCNRTGYLSVTNTSGSVTVLNTAPTAPSLYSPANASRQTGNIRTLFWNTSTDVNTEDSITYYIFHSNNASSITILGNATVNISSGATTDGQTYYWYVIASDDSANSSSSGVYAYTENTPPSQPTHLTPTDGANVSGNNRSMTWSASTDSESDTVVYYWFIGTNSTPISSVACSGNTTATSSGGCATTDGVTYYWLVIAGDGYENQTATTAWSFVEKYQNATVSASPSTRTVIKKTSARYALNITNIGNATDAYNVSVNTTNTSLWNYSLSSTSVNLSRGQSAAVNYTLIPTPAVTQGNYTVRVNASLYNPGEIGTVYALTYVNVEVLDNKTSTSTTNFTANQTTEINLTNETSVAMDVVTGDNVTNATVSVIQTYGDPTNASTGDVEAGVYVNVTADANLRANITYILLRIYYTDEELAYLGITNESTLAFYWYNTSSNLWVALYAGMLDENGTAWVANTSVNTTDNYIWANLTHLSLYTIGGKVANGVSCTANGQCASGICGYDHDGVGAWCVASGYCAHDGTSTTGSCSGSYRCPSSGGNWTSCSGGCSGNACITSTTTAGGGSVTTGGAGTVTRELSIAIDRTSVELLEGGTAAITVTVENKGTSTESSVTLTVSGHGGLQVGISPADSANIESGKSRVYTVTVTAPEGTEGDYTLTLYAKSDKTSASSALAVKVKAAVLPVSEEQAQASVSSTESTIASAETQISYYEGQGWGTTDARAVLSEAGNMLVRAKSALQSEDFAEAKSLADQASSAASRALKMIVKPEAGTPANQYVLYGMVVAAIVIVLAVIFFKKRL